MNAPECCSPLHSPNTSDSWEWAEAMNWEFKPGLPCGRLQPHYLWKPVTWAILPAAQGLREQEVNEKLELGDKLSHSVVGLGLNQRLNCYVTCPIPFM